MQQPLALENATAVPQREGHCIALGKGLRLEFENARDAYLNNHVFDYDSKGRMVGRLLELAWEGLPLDTPERDIETIGNLSVDDVRAAAAEYLHPDGLTILVIGDKDRFGRPLSDFGPVNEIEIEEAQ